MSISGRSHLGFGGPNTRVSVQQCWLHQLHSHHALLTQRSKGRADSELHFYSYPDKHLRVIYLKNMVTLK